jgi:hypothetical protein
MKRILGLVLGAFLSLLANVASAQIYYLMPGDLVPSSNTAPIVFQMVDPTFNGVTVNGRSRWPYAQSGLRANAYQAGSPNFDNATNYDNGVMFVVHPEFVGRDDTTTFPTVKIKERVVFFSLANAASSFSPQYVCFKFRYRWINDGSSIDEASNFKPDPDWRDSSNCVDVTSKSAREMIKMTPNSNLEIQVVDTATNFDCSSSGIQCPRGTLIGHIYRIRANDICTGAGTPLTCCSGAGTGSCCDGPSGSATSCSILQESVQIWGVKLVVDGGL